MDLTAFAQEWAALSAREREEFARIVNRLLGSTFLSRKHEENRHDFYFVQRHEELFRAYLQLAGWDLAADQAYGVYQAVSRHGLNRLRLRLEESIILLILRLCYEEKSRQVSLTEQVSLRVQEIQEKYAALQIRRRPIDKKTLLETLNLFKRFNLLSNLDADLADPDCRLVLYPSLLLAVRVPDVQQVYEKLQSYASESLREAAAAEEEEE